MRETILSTREFKRGSTTVYVESAVGAGHDIGGRLPWRRVTISWNGECAITYVAFRRADLITAAKQNGIMDARNMLRGILKRPDVLPGLWPPVYDGPGRPFAHRATRINRSSRKFVVFSQRTGIDI